MKKLVVAAAGALIALVLWSRWTEPFGDVAVPESVGEVSASASAALSEGTVSPADANARRALEVRVATAPWADPSTGTLRVHVVHGDGRPVPMVGLSIRPRDGRHRQLGRVERATDLDGEAVAEGLPAGPVVVLTDRHVSGEVVVRAGEVTERVLVIPPGSTVDGRVVDPQGRGIAFADVWLRRNTADFVAMVVGRTDELGGFRLEGLERHTTYVGASATGHVPSEMDVVRAPPGGTQSIEIVLHPGGAQVRGLVVDARGAPVGGALVRAGGGAGRRVTPDRFVMGWAPCSTRSDEGGMFVFRALPTGEVEFLVFAPGHAPFSEHWRLEPDVRNDVTLRVDGGAGLRGHVLDAAGEPLAGARVEVEAFGHYARAATDTAADGRFDLRGLDPRRIKVTVRADDHLPFTRELTAAPGATLELDVQLEHGRVLRGRLIDADGAPLGGWWIGLVGSGLGMVRVGADGSFERPTGDHETVSLRVWCNQPRSYIACDWLGEITVSEEFIVVQVPRERMPSGTLRGRLLAADGTPRSKTGVRIEQEGRYVQYSDVDSETGAFEFGPLSPGTYELAWHTQSVGEPPRHWGEITLAPGEDRDLGVIRPDGDNAPKLGRLVVEQRRTDRVPIDQPNVYLMDAEGRDLLSIFVDSTGRGEQALVPGRYELRTMPANAQWLRHRFTISPGEDTVVDLELAPSVRRYLMFPWPMPPAIGAARRVDYVLLDAHGRVLDRDWFDQDDLPYQYMPGFGIGNHEIRLTTDTGQRFVGRFSVESLARSNVPIVVAVEPAPQ